MNLKRGIVLPVMALFMLLGNAYASNHEECADLDSMELKVKKSHLVLKDKSDEDRPACIVPGGSFAIQVKTSGGADVEAGDVTANAPGGSSLNISGSNSDDADWLVINVTGTGNPNDEVKYEIHVEGVGMLDPRVRVIDVEERRRIQLGVLEETIANWDIGVEVLEEAIRRLQQETY
jgi:hypothetical protein